MRRTIPALLALSIWLTPALAQSPNLKVTSYSVTVGTTSTNCVPANNSMTALYIENTGGANNIFYDYPTSPNSPTVAASVSTSPLLAASGNGNKWWPVNNAPRNGLNCIASGGTSTMAIDVYTPQ